VKSPVTAKVEPDTLEGIEDYQESRGIENRSEAVRRLLRAGLKRETSGPFGGTVDAFTFALGVGGAAGLFGWLAGDLGPAAGVAAAGLLGAGFYLHKSGDSP